MLYYFGRRELNVQGFCFAGIWRMAVRLFLNIISYFNNNWSVISTMLSSRYIGAIVSCERSMMVLRSAIILIFFLRKCFSYATLNDIAKKWGKNVINSALWNTGNATVNNIQCRWEFIEYLSIYTHSNVYCFIQRKQLNFNHLRRRNRKWWSIKRTFCFILFNWQRAAILPRQRPSNQLFPLKISNDNICWIEMLFNKTRIYSWVSFLSISFQSRQTLIYAE